MMDRNGRPPNFPYNQKLERLLLTYDPEIGYLELEMKRRHARALRRWLFGPNGVNIVPSDYGVMKFNLSKGWTLRLTFLGHDELAEGYADLGVDAEFIPPASGEKAPARATAEVRP
jgi:hypothetical protein